MQEWSAFLRCLPAILQSCNPAILLMQIARVVGTVVATQKHRKFEGAKLLLVQPLNLDDTPRGVALLAVDSVGAGVHEKVLVVLEGRAAGEALGRKAAPVDAAIVGIIDHVESDAG
jgi:ethanolamine utilization protein EutN